MIKSIMKRDGRVVLYDESKIASAILKALEAAREGDASVAAQVANSVEARLEDLCSDGTPQIEQIQDTVEQELMRAGCEEAAKQYILYRAERTRIREAKTSLMKSIDEITNVDARLSDMKRDNANIDGNTAMGSMLQIGTAGAKAYNAAYLLTPAQAKAYTEGDIHIHDFDFYALTTTCCQIDLLKLFHGGFSTGHGYLREPQGIASYAALAAIAIQSNQNDQHGGQSVPNFDYSMAEGIGKTFRKQYRAKLREALEDLLDTDDETALVQAAIEAGKQATGDSDVRLETHAATFDDAAAKAIAALLGLDDEEHFIEGRPTLNGTPQGDRLDGAIKAFCLERTPDEVETQLKAIGVACAPINNYEMLMSNPHVIARNDFVEWYDEESEQTLKGVAVLPPVKNNPGQIWRGAPKLGQDNEDILEELVGEIWDEHDEVTEDFRKQSDGSWIVLGSAGVDDLYERLGLPEDEDIDSNTVNGLVQEKTCRLPKVGDRFTLGSYDGVVTRTAKRRVTEVRLTPAAPAEDAEKDDEKDKRFSRLAQRGESR